MASVYDMINEPEAFFHGLMRGLSVMLVPHYVIQSSRESDLGRFDLAIIPQPASKYGAILELKIASKADDLKSKASEALAD